VHWRDDAYPVVGTSAQAAINKQIADHADLVLACLWTRFGTPTDGYGSGTEEEIERARVGGRQIFLYFVEKPVSPGQIDVAQWTAVAEYRKRCESGSLFAVAQDERELVSDFKHKLELFFVAEMNRNLFDRSRASKQVLWVDDRPENNGYIRELLEGFGVEFSLALTTREALRMLNSRSYALVISDMGRREGPREGYALLDRMREEGDRTPLIFFASSRAPQHIAETKRHGGQGCTDDGAELVDMVFKILIRGQEVE